MHHIASHRSRGFSLIELMVAMALSVVLVGVMINVYLHSASSVRRQEQLNSLQQNVRVAFEYLASDARMIGHLGCFTRKAVPTNNLGSATLDTNYQFGVEGYEYTTAGNAVTLSSLTPTDVSSAANWEANAAPSSISPIDPALISSGGASGGLAAGSDVLVIRTVAGPAVRLTAATGTPNATDVAVENVPGGTCSSGVAKVSGFCANSHALIASCATAHIFQVGSIAGSTLTLAGGTHLGTDPAYPTTSTEVFPLQTVVYYVKASDTGMSLFRRIFDGDVAGGTEQELIDNVENMQVRYGVDTNADEAVDQYVTASSVTDWASVVAVRMSLLLRSADPISNDLAAQLPTSALVNDVTVTFPSGAGVRNFDRRVFTTTVAVRNRISYGL